MEHPFNFAMIVAVFILAAASYAFVLAYILRNYFLMQTHPRFPMSQLIHDVVYIDKNKQSRFMMFSGLFLSTCWDIFSFVGKLSLSPYNSLIHMAPLLSSVGFMAAIDIAIPIFLGLITRVVVLNLVHIYIPSNLTDHSFLITFCSGMIFSWFVFYTLSFWTKKSVHYWKHKSFLLKMSTQKWFVWWYLATALVVFTLFAYWNIKIVTMLIIFIVLMWLARYMIDIVSTVGVIEVDTYVWFILLIVIYFTPIASLNIVALSVFSMLCLGMVVDLLFSYKLADLSGIDYRFITRYQIVAVICSSLTAGFLFWYISKTFDIGSFNLISDKAHELDSIMRFGKYDYKIFAAGFVYSAILGRFFKGILTIVGAVLMTPFVSTMLVASGAVAHLVKNREQYYPLCFGIYAGHMLWMILSVFM
jgi:hypothetical protein